VAITYTPRLGLPQYGATTDPLTRAQVNAAFLLLDNILARGESGAGLNTRPAASIRDRLWTDTTTNAVYRDTGTAWTTVAGYVPGTMLVQAAAGQDTTTTPIFRVRDTTYGDVFRAFDSRVTVDATTSDAATGVLKRTDTGSASEVFSVWPTEGTNARISLGVSTDNVNDFNGALTFRHQIKIGSTVMPMETTQIRGGYGKVQIRTGGATGQTPGQESWDTRLEVQPMRDPLAETLRLFKGPSQTGRILSLKNSDSSDVGTNINADGSIEALSGAALGTAKTIVTPDTPGGPLPSLRVAPSNNSAGVEIRGNAAYPSAAQLRVRNAAGATQLGVAATGEVTVGTSLAAGDQVLAGGGNSEVARLVAKAVQYQTGNLVEGYAYGDAAGAPSFRVAPDGRIYGKYFDGDISSNLPFEPADHPTPATTIATGWSLTSAQFRHVSFPSAGYSLVQWLLVISRTGAALTFGTTGNITDNLLITLPAGFRPVLETPTFIQIIGNGMGSGRINASGQIHLQESAPGSVVGVGQELRIGATFLAAGVAAAAAPNGIIYG
jgi:hypothetical protein